jgi:flagellar biosynthesis/type III secretory pathway protein FliH
MLNKDVLIKPDDSLEPGDCIVITDFGGKDGTLKQKLKKMEQKLLKGATSNVY